MLFQISLRDFNGLVLDYI